MGSVSGVGRICKGGLLSGRYFASVGRKYFGWEVRSKKGFTLIELLICLALMAILTTVTTLSSFPKEDQLVALEPQEALESVIYRAKPIANYYAKPMRVNFIGYKKTKDSCLPANGSNNDSRKLDWAISGGGQLSGQQKESCEEFKKAVLDSNGNFKENVLLLTDTDGRVIFFNDKICYQIVKGPSNSNNRDFMGAGGSNDVFIIQQTQPVSGSNQFPIQSYFKVCANGICDSVRISLSDYYTSGQSKAYNKEIDFFGKKI